MKDLPFYIQAIGAFLALFLTDIFWAVYIKKVNEGAATMSGVWAVMLFLSGGFAVVSYTTNHWLLFPAALGAFAGTWVAVKKKL